jgi:predicted nucleotidyltransferase
MYFFSGEREIFMHSKNPENIAPKTVDGFNFDAAAANLKKRFTQQRRQQLDLLKKASQDCASIIQIIINDFHPRRIYQWGSLLHPERFNEHSDIDIAVEGITDTETYFRLLGDAMNLTRFSLDIVQMEKIEPEFAESIRLTGKVVYERA